MIDRRSVLATIAIISVLPLRIRNDWLLFLLTKLATIGQCVSSALLTAVGAELLDDDEEQKVWIYGTPEFCTWRDVDLPQLPSHEGSELPPVDELNFFLRALMLKKNGSGQLSRLRPTKNGVWEIKPSQIRVFGWFQQPLQLILCRGVPVSDVKDVDGDGYKPHYQHVQSERKRLRLDYCPGDIIRVLATN